MKTPYRPINCNFYDQLEAWSVQKQQLTLVYLNEKREEQTIEGLLIKNLQTKKGAEYAHFSNELILRLDQIISLS